VARVVGRPQQVNPGRDRLPIVADVRQLRLELSSGVPARLAAFAVVLALAAGGGWTAGQSVGPVKLPATPGTEHNHGGAGHPHAEGDR
jgi:hypothetical protein